MPSKHDEEGVEGTSVSGALSAVTDTFRAFFRIRKGDGAVVGGVRVATAAIKRTAYVVADYWLAILSAWIVGFLTYRGLGFWQIALVMWVYDLVVAFVFLYANEKSGHDITLAESFRRAVDELHRHSKFTGMLVLLGVVLRATIWDGPEQVVIFFRKELRTMFRMSALLVLITSGQAIFWTWIYGLGFEGVSELVGHLFR
ncbi:MAG: hypothetical protein HGA38_02130 [Candidatus Moranbacteria bacterium]|nr:hypothetical protein [Candidatus Moranbacteria bacterium]NTW45693.1 hypothetical protein [Candidatus Moranbacteria bacterium]